MFKLGKRLAKLKAKANKGENPDIIKGNGKGRDKSNNVSDDEFVKEKPEYEFAKESKFGLPARVHGKKIANRKFDKDVEYRALYQVRCFEMAKDGYNVNEMAIALDCSVDDLKKWIAEKPDMKELIRQGHLMYLEDYRDRFSNLKSPQMVFLIAYSHTGSVVRAKEITGIGSHYIWMKEEEYAKAFEEANAESIDRLLAEARRRAIDGVERMKFFQGQPIFVECPEDHPNARMVDGMWKRPYTENIYSDPLLIKLLENLHSKFLPKSLSVEHSGNIMTQIVDRTTSSSSSIVIDDNYIEKVAEQLTYEDAEFSTDSDTE